MAIRDYFRILRERWKLVVILTLLGVAVGVLVTSISTREYEASTQVFVSSSNATDPLNAAQGAVYAQSQVATYAAIVTTPDVLNAVLKDVNTPLTSQQLKSKITADSPAVQTLVNIHVTDGSASQAAVLANSVARAFVTAVEKYTTPVGSKKPAVQLFITDPATAPSTPVSPNAVLNIAAGLFVGLLIGLSSAVLREILDNRIKDPDVLARSAGKPLMGVIVDDPKASRHPIAARAGSRNSRAENFRQLRANLQFANVDSHPRVIAITSSIPSEGKTMVAMNLASTLAEAGFTVCLVDADLRRPTVAKSLGLPSTVGLTSVLIHQLDISEALQAAGTNLFVLSSGPPPPNPSEVLASSYVREIIRSLLARFDYVVIDTAPLLPVADGSEVAALADGALLVARYKQTTDAQIKRAVSSLDGVNANLLGVVLNRVDDNRRGRDYGYGYSYHRTEDDKSTRKPPRPTPTPAVPPPVRDTDRVLS